MQGRRLPDSVDGVLPQLEPGDYIQITGGAWYDERRRQFPDKPIWICSSPNGSVCSLNALHNFALHEDGTLTVAPSILISRLYHENGEAKSQELWHGYLERGVWRTV
jgi:hypothetical protein